MLRTNVSTRPFYNERAVHLALGVVAAVLLLLTLFNVGRAIALSTRNTDLGAQIRRDEEQAAKLEKDARLLRSRINQAELETVVAAAREANALIDQRTFSWTEFFNLIESTLPADVMLTSVTPEVKDGKTEVSMVVAGKTRRGHRRVHGGARRDEGVRRAPASYRADHRRRAARGRRAWELRPSRGRSGAVSLWRRIFDEKRRLIVPLLVAVAVNIAVYAFVVYPMERRVATADARAEAAATARKIAERNFQNAQATVTGKDRADEELQRFYQRVLPANQTAARRITYVRLARMAREAGLRPDRGESVAEVIRESRLSRLTTRMVLDGQYSEIRQFLHQIETSPEFTVIQDVKLDRMSAEDSALVLDITVSTYYWSNGNGD